MNEQVKTRSDVRSTIVSAASRLLRSGGPAAVTTRAVAEQAGVQAPTIYRLFGDKDGLLEAVAEDVMASFVSAKTAVVEAAERDDVDPLQDLREGWQAQIDFGVGNPALFRLLSDPSRVLGSPAARSGKQVLESRVHRVALLGLLKVSERRAVDLIQAAGNGVIIVLLSTPPELRDAGLADSMYEAVLQQILTDAPTVEGDARRSSRADDGRAAAIVTVRAAAPALDGLSESEQRLLAEWLDRAAAAAQ